MLGDVPVQVSGQPVACGGAVTNALQLAGVAETLDRGLEHSHRETAVCDQHSHRAWLLLADDLADELVALLIARRRRRWLSDKLDGRPVVLFGRNWHALSGVRLGRGLECFDRGAAFRQRAGETLLASPELGERVTENDLDRPGALDGAHIGPPELGERVTDRAMFRSATLISSRAISRTSR